MVAAVAPAGIDRQGQTREPHAVQLVHRRDRFHVVVRVVGPASSTCAGDARCTGRARAGVGHRRTPSRGQALMETGFVILSYVVTFGGIAILVAAMMRRARGLSARLPPEDKPWT